MSCLDRTHAMLESSVNVQTIELMRKEGLKVSTQCMNTLMGVCVQAREPNTALQVFRSMDEEGIPKDMVGRCHLASVRASM